MDIVLDKAIRLVMNAVCAYTVDVTCRRVFDYYNCVYG